MVPINRHDMSNRKMLRILLQEIADVRFELKGDIADLRKELKGDTADLRKELKQDIAVLKSDVGGLRVQLHQNHTAFITNQGDLENRVRVLETARS